MLALFESYVPAVILALISLIIGCAVLLLSKILGPKKETEIKGLPYECGMDPLQTGARERYSVHFYLVAILFILFDLETVFLFPWAATFKDGVAGSAVKMVLLVEMLLFVGILGFGLFYVWKRKGLKWD